MINIKISNDINKFNAQEELTNIELLISIQKQKKENLLNCLNNINASIQDMNNIETLNNSVQLLKNIKSCLDTIRKNLTCLEKLKNLLEPLSNNLDSTFNINEYNINFNIAINQIFANSEQIENFLSQYIQNSTYIPSENITKEENKITEKTTEVINNIKTNNIETNSNSPITDNLLLLISEKENKVFLPYKLTDLQKELSYNKNYKSIQEIIDKEYILSLEKFKNPIIARFRESYNLMKNKEKASVFDSLDLALELCFNSLLNPAVISACKNLDELDIYLDYLNSNELDKFKLFEVKYELMPKKI